MDISPFSTWLPLQLCILISRLHRKGFFCFPQRENMPWLLWKKKAEMAKKGDKIRFHELLPPGQLSYIVAAWWTMWWSMGVITSVWLCSTASSINLGGFLWQRDTLRLSKPSSAIQRQLVIYRIYIQSIIHQSFRFSWEVLFSNHVWPEHKVVHVYILNVQ